MHRTTLGPSFATSALGLGCMGMTFAYGSADSDRCLATLDRALEAGDWRRGNPRFQGKAFEANLELVGKVQAMAADKGVTAAQLALAWVLAQGEDIVPIPGTTRPERVDENVAALEVDLTEADLVTLDAIAPLGVAAGDRYPTAMMGTLNA